MDAKRKAAIIKALLSDARYAKDRRFDPSYSRENRLWFVTAIVDGVIKEVPPPADDKVEGLAHTIIGDANFAVTFDRDLSPTLTLDQKLSTIERKDLVRRVETSYGVIAQKKELAKHDKVNPSNTQQKFRQFIAKRRYRGVLRMIYHVNPNSNGFMRYPYECKSNQRWRVNVDAQSLWKKTGAADVPLTVADNIKPDDAAAKIWAKPFPKGQECNGNLLDCANTVCCVLMDSLFEAKDPVAFLKALKDRATNYFLIVNPNKESETHFLWDKETESNKVFTKEMVVEGDFQIGDHVVVQNHGLYASLVPGGLWVAEHSLVTNLGNRNPNDGKGLLFGGHGLDTPFSMTTIYDDLIKTLQTHLHRIYRIADPFLRFMRDPTASGGIPPAQVVKKAANVEVTDPRTKTKIRIDGYEVFFDFVYDNYRKPPKGGKLTTITEGEGANPLVIFDIKQTKEIAIAPPTEKNKVIDQIGKMNIADAPVMIFLRRQPGTPASGENYYDRKAWKIPFFDGADQEKFHPLFGGPGGAFKQLERNEMPTGNGRYFRAGHSEPGAFITRPKVDTSASYLTFLASIGAV